MTWNDGCDVAWLTKRVAKSIGNPKCATFLKTIPTGSLTVRPLKCIFGKLEDYPLLLGVNNFSGDMFNFGGVVAGTLKVPQSEKGETST